MNRYTVAWKPLQQTEISPAATKLLDDGLLFIDFGRAAFGTLLVPAKGMGPHDKLVRLG